MSKAIFDTDYKVTGAFDPGDKGWWRLTDAYPNDDHHPNGGFDRVEAYSVNGTIILRGAFVWGSDLGGTINKVIFKDTSDKTIVELVGLDQSLDPIMDIMNDADDWPDQDQAWAISDILLADLTRIDLSDKSDTTDREWLDEFGTMKVYAGKGNDLVYGEDGKDRIFGGDGDDTLKGADNNDRLKGNSGADKLQGSSGNDTLEGGSGNDTLEGGNGRDRLSGDGGNDKLTGGGGNDVFQFAKGAGTKDRITDFADGADMIRIGKGASDFGDLSLKTAGDDVKVKFADVVFYVEDMAKSDLTRDDFLF